AGQSLTLSFAPAPGGVAAQQANVTVIAPSTGNEVSDEDDGSDDTNVQPAAPTPAGKLLSLAFSPSVDHDITVSRVADGSFAAQDQKKDLKVQYHRAGA